MLIRFILVMAPAVFLINGLFKTGDNRWLNALLFALSVAVGLTPEMLPMIVSANLAKSAVVMSNMIHFTPEDFKVSYFQNGETGELTLDGLKGHWSILFFYPADFTFVCPTELGDMADAYDKFQAEGCEVYSVSEDTHFVHKA